MHRLGGILLLFVGLLLSSSSVLAQTKIPRFLRFDLFASFPVGPLTNGVILTSEGTVQRQFNQSSSVRPRTYSVEIPIVRWKWTRHEFEFLPAGSGTVELKLMGPWEPISPGVTAIFQQEVLWDGLESDGTTIPNPSFETVSGSTISRWSGGQSQVTSVAVPVAHGIRCARTWHDAPMTVSLVVTGGVPVRLKFWARAHVPAGFREMARIAGTDTPAHRALQKFRRGINLGNYLEMAPGSAGALTYGDSDFNLIKAEGFDHVRIPVTWNFYTGSAPNYPIASTVFTRLDFLVNRAVSRGLGVLIDWHHFEPFMNQPYNNTNQFYAVWQQIAEYYRHASDLVAFELLNEPIHAAHTLVMNRIYPEAIRRIRLSNPNRALFVGPGNANSIDSLQELMVPDEDANLIVTVHCYDPFYFTHQGTTWTGADTATRGVVFPGPPPSPLVSKAPASSVWVSGWFETYNSAPPEVNPGGPFAFREKMKRAREWSEHFGRPVHVGEFGAFETADNVSRVNFYREIRRAMEENGLAWAMWDWKAGFHYIRGSTPHPPGMREAMFPPIELYSAGAGRLGAEAAAGKIFIIERAQGLGAPFLWSPIATQQLAAPRFEFVDPDAAGGKPGAGFYRVRWER